MPKDDLTGRTFGRLAVRAFAGRDVRGRARWACTCTCSAHVVVDGFCLKAGRTTSCGCRQKEEAAKARRTHGEAAARKGTRTPEYITWTHVLNRCLNKRAVAYENYGARGVTVDPHWTGTGGYENFLNDMGRRPGPAYSIERKNNNLGYSKDNCTWATQKVQQNNRRSNRWITFRGETLTLSQWGDKTGIKSGTLGYRLARGWPVSLALGIT